VRTTDKGDCVWSAGRVNHRRRPGRHLATGAAPAIQPRAAERDVEIVTEIVPTTMRPPKLIVGPNRCYGDKSPPRSTSSQRNTPTTRPAVAAKIYIDTTDNGPQATADPLVDVARRPDDSGGATQGDTADLLRTALRGTGSRNAQIGGAGGTRTGGPWVTAYEPLRHRSDLSL